MEGEYYVDTTNVEHGCCHDATVCKKVKEGSGMYGEGYVIIAECRSIEDANLIVEALNNKTA